MTAVAGACFVTAHDSPAPQLCGRLQRNVGKCSDGGRNLCSRPASQVRYPAENFYRKTKTTLTRRLQLQFDAVRLPFDAVRLQFSGGGLNAPPPHWRETVLIINDQRICVAFPKRNKKLS